MTILSKRIHLFIASYTAVSNSTTLESLLDLMCTDVFNVIEENFDKAKLFVEEIRDYAKLYDLFMQGIG